MEKTSERHEAELQSLRNAVTASHNYAAAKKSEANAAKRERDKLEFVLETRLRRERNDHEQQLGRWRLATFACLAVAQVLALFLVLAIT